MKASIVVHAISLPIVGSALLFDTGLADTIPRSAQVNRAPAEPEQPLPSRELESAIARRDLVSWLECEECADGELQKVVEHGDLVVSNLAAALEFGLSPSRRREIERHLRETHGELVKYRESHPRQSLPMTITEEETVRIYLDNAQARYQWRAATALIRMGTPAARAALAAGLEARSMRPELRERIATELAR